MSCSIGCVIRSPRRCDDHRLFRPCDARPIEVTRASKIYRRYSHRKQFATLKSALLSRSLIRNLRPDETFTALDDVSFTVPKGRTLGVIGRNGSGKSTLLKLVAGITKPSSGSGDGAAGASRR